ncbi:MAG: LPS export ABC transporter periplasmic protein LptC, partial [Burkholderiales bacterium]|nr:LPS export ABC transporter periplasmic protein LptC [Burkholderiales bacterium]
VDNFHFVRVTATGQPHYIMSGKNLVHRPVTDRSDIVQAQLLNFYAEQAPLTINANQAQLDHKENTVELSGNVLVVRADSPVAQGWTMKTEAMTLLPDEDRMQTKAAVEIVNGRTVTQALGMEIDNTTGSLKLAQQVHGIFQPPPATATPSKAKKK